MVDSSHSENRTAIFQKEFLVQVLACTLRESILKIGNGYRRIFQNTPSRVRVSFFRMGWGKPGTLALGTYWGKPWGKDGGIVVGHG